MFNLKKGIKPMKKASAKTMSLLAIIGCIFFSGVFSANAQSFIQTAKETGVTIREEGDVRIWEGPYTGKMKPEGPLSEKTIGVLVASEFSDFQAQYIYSYASEFGGKVEFLKVGWVKWKFTRPNVKNKGVHGIWGTGLSEKDARYTSKSIREANPGDYDALVVLGGHSADIMTSEQEVIDFIKTVHNNGGFIGSIGGGSLPLIRAGIMEGKNVTGNRVVSFMLKEISNFEDTPVARDGQIITARNTVNTPAFLRELCKAFEPGFKPERDEHDRRAHAAETGEPA